MTDAERVVETLRGGGIVLLPTDTVYGLAVHPVHGTGALAAGKTTFAAAAAAAIGSPDRVTSPTFMLAQFYAGGRVPVLHVDTFRLAGVAEFRDLGLDEQLAESVTLVEWGGLVEGELPEHLAVTLTADPADDQRRTIAITGHGARWSGVPEAIESELLSEAA